jgi:hypothetical protein
MQNKTTKELKINEKTKWGDICPSMSFLDHPVFNPNSKANDIPGAIEVLNKKASVRMDKIVKPKLSVMGYNKDDSEPSYTDVIYEKLQTAKRTIARLELELEDTKKNLARMWESKK